ncbi:MAG: phosphatidate cytidylyltransferase [Flavobacterium sp.]|nr:MAG: phosphatidate cytidylyltransferase [Flavobacterium sp.]
MNENVVRTLSGITYIVLLVAATLYSEISFVLLFGLFLFLAVYEFCLLTNLKKVIPFAMAAAGFALFGIYKDADFWSNILLNLGALMVSVRMIFGLFSKKPPKFKDQASKLVTLTGYIIIPFLLLIKLPFLSGTFKPQIIIGIFILIWVNDTFAYIVGKTMGRTKLFERISPKKTVEGFAGGLFFAMIGSYIISLYFTFYPTFVWIISAIILVIFGTLGDLIESKLKRTAGVKDSGRIMPGHGGILDRLDSIIFAIPFLFLFYQILNYVS